MRESMITIPKTDNSGRSLDSVVQFAQRKLCKAFGGCTTRDAFGQWVSPSGELISEPVFELVAACEPSAETRRTLHDLAADVGAMGNQQAVYVRYASGDVEILDTANAMVPMAA